MSKFSLCPSCERTLTCLRPYERDRLHGQSRSLVRATSVGSDEAKIDEVLWDFYVTASFTSRIATSRYDLLLHPKTVNSLVDLVSGRNDVRRPAMVMMALGLPRPSSLEKEKSDSGGSVLVVPHLTNGGMF